MSGPLNLYGENPDEVIALAKVIYEELERIDPTPGQFVPYEELDFIDQESMRCAAAAVFREIRSRSVTRPTTAS